MTNDIYSDSVIRKAVHWMTRSGIQNPGPNPRHKGGVAAWYQLFERIYPFLYSEITGYALTTLIFLWRLERRRKYLDHASLAVDWLLHNALSPEGGVKTRLYLVKHYTSPNYSFERGRLYAFDSAMVAYGLLQYFKATRDERVLRAVEKIMDFLARRMRRPDGRFYAYFDVEAKARGEDFEKWSNQGGPYHAKIAILFIDYYRLTGISAYRDYARVKLDGVCRRQQKDGRFITNRKDKSTHLHAHAYAVEGLLYGAHFLGERRYWRAVWKAFLWMQRGVSVDGSVSCNFVQDRFSYHERSDIVAQVLRIGSILHTFGRKEMRPFLPVLESIKRHLLIFQYNDGSLMTGGFVYGAATDGSIRRHLNAWSTMFAIQALWMHDEFVLRKKPLSLDCFV